MPSLDRRTVLAGAGALAMSRVARAAAPPFAWQTVAPADAGFARQIADRLDKLIANKRVWNLHGVVVLRGRKIVLERYFAGADESWANCWAWCNTAPTCSTTCAR